MCLECKKDGWVIPVNREVEYCVYCGEDFYDTGSLERRVFHKPKTSALYDIYMRSPGWRMKRRQILEIDGNCCRRCGSSERLEVHHLTYRRLGAELPEDLITLCHRCHMKGHKKKRQHKYSKNVTFH